MERIQRYYNSNPQKEQSRLSKDAYHSIESEITKKFLSKYLKSGDRVADIGCGAGHYSLWLMQKGHDVLMSDLSQELLECAKKEVEQMDLSARLIDVKTLNATQLHPIGNHLFDVTLCFGPFYHLLEQKERLSALREIKRITKPGGLIFVATINRLCPIRDMMHGFTAEWAQDIADNYDEVLELLQTGTYKNETEDPRAFTDAYFAQPTEIPDLFKGENIELVEAFSCEGIAAFLDEKAEIVKAHPKAWDHFLDLVFRTASDASVLGSGEHSVYIGRIP